MSNIGGKKKEQLQVSEFTKKVGLFESKVIAVNPSLEEYKDLLNIELKEDSKAVQYLGRNDDGNITLRVDFWLEEVKHKEKYKVSFFLENKDKVNKDGSKKQYINSIGTCSWVADVNDLPEWFAKRDYRVAFVGEEELYNFMKTWLGNLDYREAETTLQLDWKKLMKGNVKDIKDQINGEWCTTVVSLATVKTVVKEDESKEYQGVYNKAFLPAYSIKQFRLINGPQGEIYYSKPDVLSMLRQKKSKDLKPHERFVLNVTGEYGCKDYYILKEIEEYNPTNNFAASDKVIADDDASY